MIAFLLFGNQLHTNIISYSKKKIQDWRKISFFSYFWTASFLGQVEVGIGCLFWKWECNFDEYSNIIILNKEFTIVQIDNQSQSLVKNHLPYYGIIQNF